MSKQIILIILLIPLSIIAYESTRYLIREIIDDRVEKKIKELRNRPVKVEFYKGKRNRI